MIPSIYGVLILLFAPFLSANGTIALITICTVLGGTAAGFLIGLGGATINPAVFSLIFVFWQAWRNYKNGELPSVLPLNSPANWLMILAIWGVISAATLPFLFQNSDVLIFTFDRFEGGTAPFAIPIRFTSSNISQPGYLVMSWMAMVAMCILLRREGAAEVFAKSVLWASTLNVALGCLNLLQMAGLPDVLAVLRNGSYAMQSGELAGLVRISGAFPETSAYSAYSLTLLGFTHYLWLRGYLPRWSSSTSVGSLVLLLLSTSGTAYVGLAVCGVLSLMYLTYRVARYGSAGRVAFYGWLALLALILLASALLFYPKTWTILSDYFGFVVGKKMESGSGIERSTWNRQAWSNFIDTLGLGTGLGTNVGSNFTMVLLSNLGWFGAMAFGAFIWKSFTTPISTSTEAEDIVIKASRLAILTTLIGANISARVFDLSITFYIFAAGATFRATPTIHPKPTENSGSTT
ncbi:MAG: hypothetical protein ACOYNB_05420 [Aquabacterium sp.]|uniref:hypothetical protein n=1 Tax=Aquabacterium sp. TaxID=1872578 RepID=UPI003BE907E9